MIEREHDPPEVATADTTVSPKTVIAVGKLVDRVYERSPELVTLDPATLWPLIDDAYGNDAEAQSLLGDVKAACMWPMAVLLAKLIREVYETGRLEEQPRSSRVESTPGGWSTSRG
jgi:hypothetical protein